MAVCLALPSLHPAEVWMLRFDLAVDVLTTRTRLMERIKREDTQCQSGGESAVTKNSDGTTSYKISSFDQLRSILPRAANA